MHLISITIRQRSTERTKASRPLRNSLNSFNLCTDTLFSDIKKCIDKPSYVANKKFGTFNFPGIGRGAARLLKMQYLSRTVCKRDLMLLCMHR